VLVNQPVRTTRVFGSNKASAGSTQVGKHHYSYCLGSSDDVLLMGWVVPRSAHRSACMQVVRVACAGCRHISEQVTEEEVAAATSSHHRRKQFEQFETSKLVHDFGSISELQL
jgi:hypothetical protein